LSANPSASTSATQRPSALAALLVLDADGKVELASQAARQLWQAGENELVGDLLPHLFVFDVIAHDADWLQAQWEVLVAAAATQPVPLKLSPREAAPFDVEVRLEKAAGTPPRYLAQIRVPQLEAVAATVAAGAPDRLQSLLHERCPLAFFEINFLKGEAFYAPAFRKLLGHTEQTLAANYDAFLGLLHPDDTAAAPDKQGRTGSPGGRPFSVEFRAKHVKGHYLWVQCAGLHFFGPNGSLQRVVGALLDIQDRKEFEEASLRAEERLQQLSERAGLGAFDLDFAGNNFWLSPALRQLAGYGDADLPDTAAGFAKLVPESAESASLAAYFLGKHAGEIAYYDSFMLRHREGRDLWAYAGIYRQISRRKELQRVIGYVLPMPEGLAAPATAGGLPPEHFAAVLAAMHEGVVLVDAQGRVVFLNAKAEKLLGATATDAAGKHSGDVFRLVHRATDREGEDPVDKVLTTGEATPLDNEFAVVGPGGARVPVAWACQPVLDASGRPGGAVLVFRNPDEMGLSPEELVKSSRFESLGRLAGGIAHDFNNLLTTILGGISLALDNRDYSALENSAKAVDAAKGLSRQLLLFSKGGTGTRQVLKPVDFLKDAVRLAAAGSAVKVELNVAPDAGTVMVDRAQILQVFQNLIINSIQAMKTGSGNIWVTAGNLTLADGQVGALPAGPYVAIEVRDNGSGITPENLQRIWDPFFTTKKTGTGLGLATVLSIVKRHGGLIGVESEVGVGTAFTAYLPVTSEEIKVEARRAAAFNYANRTGRVLFMDDDPQISALTGTMLEGLEYKYDLAKNGEEAVQLYKRYLNIGRPYDVVIMDLTVIGGMGGEQTFKVLKELDPNVRAIVASGYDNDEMSRQFLDMGFLGYLTKPYRVGDLGRIIKKVVGG